MSNAISVKSADWNKGVASSEVKEGAMLGGKLHGEDVLLLRKNGRICALSATCTHQGANLAEGALTGTSLRCPWHHARFDIETGEAVGAPAFEPLAKFDVSEKDGQITFGEKRQVPAPRQVEFAMQVVIVGAGAGGHACAEWLARRGAGAQVTLVGEEEGEPYDRTVCSKQLLAGKLSREEATLPALAGVRRLSGTAVASIDPAKRTVELSDGKTLDYDALVIATGATPVAAEFEGSDHAAVMTLRGDRDAAALVDAASHAKRVVVVGASFIGLEAAASLRGRGLDVTVVAPDPIPLAAKFGEEVGTWVQNLHEKHGIAFRLKRKVSRFDGSKVRLDDGEEIDANLVVVGTGVTPRLELAKAAGLELASEKDGGGVLVDEALRTSDSRVHAIGDIASFTDARLGKRMRVEHWVVAQRQGQFVARFLLGESERYVDTPFFWSGHYDQSLHYIGHGKPADRITEGEVDAGDFLVSYEDGETTAAQLSCGRDQDLLSQEARWDAEVLGTTTAFDRKS